MQRTLIVVLLAIGFIVILAFCRKDGRKFPPHANGAPSAGEILRESAYRAGYSLGQQSAMQGNGIPKDLALRNAGELSAQRAGVAALDRKQYIDAYVTGFEAGFKALASRPQ